MLHYIWYLMYINLYLFSFLYSISSTKAQFHFTDVGSLFTPIYVCTTYHSSWTTVNASNAEDQITAKQWFHNNYNNNNNNDYSNYYNKNNSINVSYSQQRRSTHIARYSQRSRQYCKNKKYREKPTSETKLDKTTRGKNRTKWENNYNE